jgi:hypothetical protein
MQDVQMGLTKKKKKRRKEKDKNCPVAMWARREGPRISCWYRNKQKGTRDRKNTATRCPGP